MAQAEYARVEIAQKKAQEVMYASVPLESWFGEVINKLDGPLSRLVISGDLTATSFDRLLQNWVAENGESAKRILWFFDKTQYPHNDAFGFLVADLEEDGRQTEVEEFFKALVRERDRT